MELWILDQLAQRYPGLGSPSGILKMPQKLRDRGYSDDEADAVALDFDRACLFYGRWTDAREQATREVTLTSAERKKKPTKQVRKYSSLKAVLGLAPTREGPHEQQPALESPDVEAKIDRLRRDPAAMVAYLREIGEG